MLILLQGNDCLINYRIMSYYFRLPPITQLTLSQQERSMKLSRLHFLVDQVQGKV